jgi:hypothetical protein
MEQNLPKATELSSLVRGISFKYPSNVFIIINTVLTAFIFMLFLPAHILSLVYSEQDYGYTTDAYFDLVVQLAEPAIVGAIFIAAAVFLTWAIARELDPDRPMVANLASVLLSFYFLLSALSWSGFNFGSLEELTLEGIFYLQQLSIVIDLLVMLLSLLFLRIAARTTGKSLTWADFALLLILFLTFLRGAVNLADVIICWIGVIAVGVNAFSKPTNRKSIAFSVSLMLVTSLLSLFYISEVNQITVFAAYPNLPVWAILIITGIFGLLINLTGQKVDSLGDADLELLDISRIKWTRIIAVLLLLAQILSNSLNALLIPIFAFILVDFYKLVAARITSKLEPKA